MDHEAEVTWKSCGHQAHCEKVRTASSCGMLQFLPGTSLHSNWSLGPSFCFRMRHLPHRSHSPQCKISVRTGAGACGTAAWPASRAKRFCSRRCFLSRK